MTKSLSAGINDGDSPVAIGRRKQRIDASAWAAFIIWIGVAIFANVGWALFLIGVGAIILGAEGATLITREKGSLFWMVCGLAIVAAGISEMLDTNWRIGPALVILAGVVMLWRALFGVIRPA